MSETPVSLTPEQIKAAQEAEEEERLKWFEANHPELFGPPEPLKEGEPEVAEYEEMLATFEKTYSLEELKAITKITPDESSRHHLRGPAIAALIPILKQYTVIKESGKLPEEKVKALYEKYKVLARAVGMIMVTKEGYIVDHTR